MVDHVTTRRQGAKECRETHAMRSVECSSDHLMHRTVLSMKYRPPICKRGVSSRKLNTNLLKSQDYVQTLKDKTSRAIAAQPTADNESINDSWSAAAKKLREVATEVLGFRERVHNDWFGRNDAS